MVLHRPARPGGPMTAPQTESPAGASRATVTPTPDNATTGQLIGQLTEQISRLVRDEARLAQAEVTQKAKRLGVGAGLFGGVRLVAFFWLAALTIAGILALALVLPDRTEEHKSETQYSPN